MRSAVGPQQSEHLLATILGEEVTVLVATIEATAGAAVVRGLAMDQTVSAARRACSGAGVGRGGYNCAEPDQWPYA